MSADAAAAFLKQRFGFQQLAGGQDRCALDRMQKLADVAWRGVGKQSFVRGAGEPLAFPSGGLLIQKAMREPQDVFRPFPQRPNFDLNDVDAVVKLFAESPLFPSCAAATDQPDEGDESPRLDGEIDAAYCEHVDLACPALFSSFRPGPDS